MPRRETAQELAYNNQLIEIYGTPYPDDIGPGGFYPQGYTGPDLHIHYMYVDDPDTNTYGGTLPDPTAFSTNYLFIGQIPTNWLANVYNNFDFYTNNNYNPTGQDTNFVAYVLGPDGYIKPQGWTGERVTPGSIQTAVTGVNEARDKLRIALANTFSDKQNLDRAFALFQAQTALQISNLNLENSITLSNRAVNDINSGFNIASSWLNTIDEPIRDTQAIAESTADSSIAGTIAIPIAITAAVGDVLENVILSAATTVAREFD